MAEKNALMDTLTYSALMIMWCLRMWMILKILWCSQNPFHKSIVINNMRKKQILTILMTWPCLARSLMPRLLIRKGVDDIDHHWHMMLSSRKVSYNVSSAAEIRSLLATAVLLFSQYLIFETTLHFHLFFWKWLIIIIIWIIAGQLLFLGPPFLPHSKKGNRGRIIACIKIVRYWKTVW